MVLRSPSLRLLADDLTGALDSAARFVPLVGPVPVQWHTDHLPATVAIDSGTRQVAPDEARVVVAGLAPALREADIAFKKIDSLLRGPIAPELAACMPYFDHCVLAPAFPYQGRITRHGHQLIRDGNGWRDSGVDLAAELRAHGVDVPLRDAASDADLVSIVSAGRTLAGRVLWCGTGGLAGALAEQRTVPSPILPRPILALIGSDHPVSLAQLAAAGAHRLANVDEPSTAAIRSGLATGAAAVSVILPPRLRRSVAAQQIADRFATLLAALNPPGTLVVSGGETLRDLCDRLNVERIEVDGEVAPGVPTSILRGGPRDGQRLVSKSGAFGDPGFLAALLRPT